MIATDAARRERIVSFQRAKAAVERLCDSHGRSRERAQRTIFSDLEDDDIVLLDFFRQLEEMIHSGAIYIKS
jgi:hypothetical protein